MRKIFKIIILSFIFLLIPWQESLAKSYYVPQVQIAVQLNNDASANFTEKRTFDFSGSFSRIYWDIPVKGNQMIDNVSISEGTTLYQKIPTVDESHPIYKYSVERQGDSYHIEAYHQSFDEQKT